MENLIAEDLLMLLLDDKSGRFTLTSHHRQAVAGAVLAELALKGAVDIDRGKGLWKRNTARVVDATAVMDPVLRRAVDLIGKKPTSPQTLVNRIGGDIERSLCERLAERGMVRKEQAKVLGLFSRTVWPAADSSRELQVRSDLRAALLDHSEPSQQIAVLIALLLAIGRVHKVIDSEGHTARDIKKRAKEVADGGWASDAVKKALDAAQAAVIAGAIAASTAGGSG